ncbi:MAG: S8 family serine peptidase [Thermoanaerobaculia bacterium]
MRTLQTGTADGATPLHDRGIRGEGEIIAVLDTGLDWDSCYFTEADGAAPPVNTRLSDTRVDLTRRKVVAYNFLYSCDEYPGAFGCDDPSRPGDWDNQGHGTFASGAATGDSGVPLVHDPGDAIAPAAKLVIQDAGYIGGDFCTQRPGLHCPTRDLRAVYGQAYAQGARIFSNSWGDRQGSAAPVPPTANYSVSARDVDDFVRRNPDAVVVFNTGNVEEPASSTVSSPGSAKNTIQIGGTRGWFHGDDTLADFTAFGPTRDGRIKPDLVAPARVIGGAPDGNVATFQCTTTEQGGTSWASPTVAGAAALVRQYYREGFYPSGARDPRAGFAPSAALVKATLIASARAVPRRAVSNQTLAADPVPSMQQGFGFPVLDDALYFSGDALRLRVIDAREAAGVRATQTHSFDVQLRGGSSLEAVLVWTDPAGTAAGVASTTPQLVNDLDLEIVAPNGALHRGNETLHPGAPDRLNNVEQIAVGAAERGKWRVTVRSHAIRQGAAQGYALVLLGDFVDARRRAARPLTRSGASAIIPSPCFPVNICANQQMPTAQR